MVVLKAKKEEREHVTSPKLPKRIVAMNDSEKSGPIFRVSKKGSVTYIP